ncbi:glutamate 5-kinase [Candidatus Woesearchaeota archaeon]|nr:glutamate 5-kinase [Candidatus Woesearchaeota archaeon]
MASSSCKRLVLKIGTNLLTENLVGLKTSFISNIAAQAASLQRLGHDIIIVTSGAIGAGCTELGLKKTREVEVRQALAAAGQSSVMRAYHDAFSKHGIHVAQILLTYEDFSDRKKYLNLRKAIEKLVGWKVIPIINENDPISVDEIGATFGDNDKLSALVAAKMDADMLIILTDIDGLYDKNPKSSKDAKLIPRVEAITRDIERAAGKSGSQFSVGGMMSKIKAAKIAMDSGAAMVICNGRKEDILEKALAGKEGTYFAPKTSLSNRQRWIKFAKPRGRLLVNTCAKDVLLKGKSSLLSVGIEKVEGDFQKGDIIEINDFGKGVADYSSDDLEKLKGQKGKVAVKKENLVMM